MPIGTFKQNVSHGLLGFTLGCTIIIIGLLYVLVKSETLANVYVADTGISQTN